MTIHYMKGTEDKLTTATKSGCGVKSEDIKRGDCFVFWKSRNKVDCPECIKKIKRVEQLNNH